MVEATFFIEGMDCSEEVAALRRGLGRLEGIGELRFDLLRRKLAVTYDPAALSADGIAAAIARTGMRAVAWADRAPSASVVGPRPRRTLSLFAGGVLAAAGFVLHAARSGGPLAALTGAGHAVPPAARVLYALAIAAAGWPVAARAGRALLARRADMHLLMAIAVLGAVAIGEWLEASVVTVLFSISLALEAWSAGHARRAVEALMELSPPEARVRRPDGERDVPVGEVSPGEIVVVRPGERIPLDGRVREGHTSVDQAPITGESIPVAKAPGDEVFAGTINQDGAIELETTKRAGDTTLARIVRLVEEARARRSPSERWVDRFARVYTPAVLAMALLIAALPPAAFGASPIAWLYRALVLLVIACPCALVISTPVAIVAALASSARHGVLVKGGAFVESPARWRAVALDKTGTLTRGEPEIAEIVPLAGHDARDLLRRAAAVEARSEHALARAILRRAEAEGVPIEPAEGFQAVPGKGAVAGIEGRPFWLGSAGFARERAKLEPGILARIEALGARGASVIVVGNDAHVCGLLAATDRVRPEARDAIARLHDLGVRHVVMLTGDNRATAEAVAIACGVDAVRAGLLPEDKIRAIETLVEAHGIVAMVGDGVNDAPAMARATAGVAMGTIGTDAALETADIALMPDDLRLLPWLVAHARRALAIIRQNTAASIGVKALFVALAVLGRATLWAAIAADMGVSLAVVFNSLRLLGTRGDRYLPAGGAAGDGDGSARRTHRNP